MFIIFSLVKELNTIWFINKSTKRLMRLHTTKLTEYEFLKLICLLKKHLLWKFEQCLDIIGYDLRRPRNRVGRFRLIYEFVSVRNNIRLFLETNSERMDLGYEKIISCFKLYSSVEWVEREIWEMFGISFRDHPNLRRLLTDYGFDGFPLRKEFPVEGLVELGLNLECKTELETRPVEFMQARRHFFKYSSRVKRLKKFSYDWDRVTDSGY